MDYVYIRAWGIFTKATDQYVRDQVWLAHSDKAPGNVIHKREDGLWATIEDVGRNDRTAVERLAGRLMKRDNPDYPLLSKREIT